MRSLASVGYHVIAGDGGEFSTVGWSRACHEVWRHPPVDHSEAFLGDLLAFLARRPDITTLLPLQERYVALLAERRARLPDGLIVAMPRPDTVLTCLDKDRLHGVARQAGVPSRPAGTASDLDGLVVLAEQCGYPVVVRPAGGVGPLSGDRKAVIARDRAALTAAFLPWPAEHERLLVQSFVQGPRHNVYFAAREGRIVARVQTRIVRTDRPDGTGYAVEGVTVRPDPASVSACDALIEQLGYTGIGCVQFLRPRGGEPHLLELNPRHGAAFAIVQHCGLDLTLAAIALARDPEGWPSDGSFTYPPGQRYVWTTGDLNALRIALRDGRTDRTNALRWLARTIRAAVMANVHVTWSWRDPLPTLVILAQLLPSSRLKRRALHDRSATP